MRAVHQGRDARRGGGAWWGLAALLCLPLLEAAHPFLYYANHARRGYGRNIQPLPCATKAGDTGVCMFAWDCMKAEGTHLGTCIERFYFGSCCKLKPGSKKPEHTIMKTDVYVLATTSLPQTGVPDVASSSAPQAGSNLLGMITGQTTLTSESSDTSTSRTTLLDLGGLEESLSTVQEVQVVDAGVQQAEAQSASAVDLDMEAIEQQMVEESDAQEVEGSEDDQNILIETTGDSQSEDGVEVQINGEGVQVPDGDGAPSGPTFEVSVGEPITAEQTLSETIPPETQEPTVSTVEEGVPVTEESQVTMSQAGGLPDQDPETDYEELITSIQGLDEAQVDEDQNEIEGGQHLGIGEYQSSDQDQTPQVSDIDQDSNNITPEIHSQVLELDSESSQDSEPQVIGIGIGTVTSVELDYTSAATEAYVEPSEESQGQIDVENEMNSENAGEEASDSPSVTSDTQRTTVSEASDPDAYQESNSSENEVAGAEHPVESSTATDSSTVATSDEEQSGVSEVTESSHQATDSEKSETAPTTEVISLTMDKNDAISVSSEQTKSELTSDQTIGTEITAPTVIVPEKPTSQDEEGEIALQPLGSTDSTKSSEVPDGSTLADDGTTVAPQQTDSTVLPELGDSQSLSDSVSITTPESISVGESSESVSDTINEGSVSETNAVTSGGESTAGDDALTAATGTTSSETSTSTGDGSVAASGTTIVDDGADVADEASSSESAANDISDVSTGSDDGASTPDDEASVGTTVISDDLKTPDADASQAGSSTESGTKADHTLNEPDTSTKNENPATASPGDSLEQDTSTSLPSLGENVIVPGVHIVPAPGSVKNETVAVGDLVGSIHGDVSSEGFEDPTTEIPVQSISTEVTSAGSASEEVSSTEASPGEETTEPQSSSSEVSKPDESGSGVAGVEVSPPNTTTAQPEQQFATQEEQLLHRLKTSSFKEICGQPVYPSRRIVGGSQASFGEWPWQVSLRQWRSVTYLHKCGAALVNENWAITAAHCVENVLPDQLLLRLGEFDLERADEPYGHVERKVQIIATHPQFDPRTFEYDLALLRFNEPVTFQPNIIPICIPEDDYDFIGDTGFVSGWGRLYEDGPLPSLMQKVPVPVITNGECEVMYRNAGYIEDIPNIFICAGYEGGKRDSCEGDSGGPLVIQHQKSWKLAGVISWGIGCALPNQPGVYTRISAFREWINKIIVF